MGTRTLHFPRNQGSMPDFSHRPRRLDLVKSVEVKGFSKLKLRPIRLDDESKMIEFHRGISSRSVFLRYFRYLGLERRTSHERLVRVCTNTAEVYSVVIEQPAHTHTNVAIVAIGRLMKTPEPYVCMFDTLIGKEAHIEKLAGIPLDRLIVLARAFHFQILSVKLLGIDRESIGLCRKLGFALLPIPEENAVQGVLKL
jgi:acetyltransferase